MASRKVRDALPSECSCYEVRQDQKKGKNGQRSWLGTGALCEYDWRTKTSQCACVIQCGEVNSWRRNDVDGIQRGEGVA